MEFRRITVDPRQMGGVPCLRRLPRGAPSPGQADLLVVNLLNVSEALAAGSVVIVEQACVRPITPQCGGWVAGIRPSVRDLRVEERLRQARFS